MSGDEHLRPQPQVGASAGVLPRAASAERRRLSLSVPDTYWTIGVYLATRVLLLGIAVALAEARHISLLAELGRWDGTWYTAIASHGYPAHPVTGSSELGFFPLFPLVIWLVVHAPGPPNSTVVAAVLVSTVGGLIAAVLIGQLASGWWGRAAGRRASALFCLFPGSIVFSMAYSEGLLIPLAAGCILALQRRRWLLAGALAGLATASEPAALALVPACAVSAALALRRHGWSEHRARRSLLAPLLSLGGIGAFAVFLWAWTGTPFASLHAQRTGWNESLDPLAWPHTVQRLLHNLSRLDLAHPSINLGPAAALLGIPVLIGGIVLLLCYREEISPEALAWTLGIGFLTLVSEYVGPNPRLLIAAFPAVIVFARRCSGRRYGWLLVLSGLLLVVSSAITYGGHSLPP